MIYDFSFDVEKKPDIIFFIVYGFNIEVSTTSFVLAMLIARRCFIPLLYFV